MPHVTRAPAALLSALCLSTPTSAAMLIARWTGPESGLWFTAANWTTDDTDPAEHTVPTNSPNDTYDVRIASAPLGSRITLDNDPVIDRLTISGNDSAHRTVVIPGARTLTVRGGPGGTSPDVGDIINSGRINLGSLTAGPPADPVLVVHTGTVTMSGAGQLNMFNVGAGTPRISGAGGAAALIQRFGHAIAGNGNIGDDTLAITNQGVIVATDASKPLVIDPRDDASFINDFNIDISTPAALRAIDGATLSLTDGQFTNRGVIEAQNGSTVRFEPGATLTNIVDGVLTGGTYRVVSSTAPSTILLPNVPINVNNANIILDGRDATIPALSNVETISGRILLRNGAKLAFNRSVSTVDMGDDGPGTPSSGAGASAPGMQGRSTPIDPGPDACEFRIHGTFTSNSGSTWVADSIFGADDGIVFNAGTLGGQGRFESGIAGAASTGIVTVNTGATTAPGFDDVPTGLLRIAGNYVHRGALDLDIGGLIPALEYDRLMVYQSAQILEGSINVSLLDGYYPNPGDSFDVLTAPSLVISESLVSFDLPSLPGGMTWTRSIVPHADGFALNLTVVPAPSALSILLVAGASGAGQRRRRLGP